MANELDLKYSVLSQLKPNIISNIKYVYIFGENGRDVIYITNDNKVYGFGQNECGCLGLGHNRPVTEPQLINQLCGKQLFKIGGNAIVCNGIVNVFGITHRDQVYVWGSKLTRPDPHGYWAADNQLTTICKPPEIISSMDNISVIDISYGYEYTYVLTQSGDLYHLSDTNSKITSTRFSLEGLSMVVRSIACGSQHFLALMEPGHVFSQGKNGNGQLGLGHNNEAGILTPIVIEALVEKISCGQNYSLLLTTEGQIYAFGCNSCGQLGVGDRVNRNKPTLIVNSVKFIDIFAHSMHNISMAMSDEYIIYIWGDCKTGVIDCPQRTELKSFQESIVKYNKIVFTYAFISNDELFSRDKSSNPLTKVMAKAFDNPNTSDLKFSFKEENEFKYIFGHKWFIEETSEHFRTMFANEWSESKLIDGKYEIPIKTNSSNSLPFAEHSYESYYAFIKYLYTNCIDIQEMVVLIGLLDIANQYLDKGLKYKCFKAIKPMITIANVCDLYSASVKYKCHDLENYCFNFMINDTKSLIKSESYQRMDPIYAKQFTTKHIEYLNSKSNN